MIGIWLGITVNTIVSIAIIISGYFIGKGNISLIHYYHHKNVKEKDYMSYTKLYSIGMYIVGFGIFISNIFMYFDNSSGIFFTYISSFVIGFLFFRRAQKNITKENGLIKN